ncbi:MAG TPA: HRDC domain-containing protein [Planctomycetota bacterium]|nr:HRDC domain-containing protein [Planctomycetota bacterium]
MQSDLPPPTLVQDARGLSGLLADLATQTEIAVDTEADSFFNYKEKVCLIQVTVEDRDYLVDPLAGFDIAPLGEILADPAKEKIFHDGEYDVLIMKRSFGFRFVNLFDTRVAAAALGEAQPGLASVLKSRFGVELDKSMQRSNWSARPLSPKQVAYARLDTRFLIPLAREQKKELERAKRRRIVEGECRRLEQLVPADNAFEPDEFLRIQGARQLEGTAQRALRELFVLRDKLARESDLPPFKVIHNEVLVQLAQRAPASQRELDEMSGLSPRQARRFGNDLLQALARARELGPITRAPLLPSKDGTGELDDQEFELHERLKEWRREQAAKEGYDASLVLNRHVLLRLAKKKPRRMEDLEGIEGLLDWQVSELGPQLVSLIDRSLKEFQTLTPRSRRRGHFRS